MRTLETAAAAFGSTTQGGQRSDSDGRGGSDADSKADRLLMAESEQESGRSKWHAAIYDAGVPILAHEGCRECFGVRMRSSLDLLDSVVTLLRVSARYYDPGQTCAQALRCHMQCTCSFVKQCAQS